MKDPNERKWHTRHQYIKETGKSISRGGWERLNRAYDVHLSKQYVDRKSGQLVSRFTHVLMPETTKANRKVSLRDRFTPRSKRSRFNERTKVGETR